MKLIEGFQVNNTTGHTIQQLGKKKKWNGMKERKCRLLENQQ